VNELGCHIAPRQASTLVDIRFLASGFDLMTELALLSENLSSTAYLCIQGIEFPCASLQHTKSMVQYLSHCVMLFWFCECLGSFMEIFVVLIDSDVFPMLLARRRCVGKAHFFGSSSLHKNKKCKLIGSSNRLSHNKTSRDFREQQRRTYFAELK
jgi:hypothetical protein